MVVGIKSDQVEKIWHDAGKKFDKIFARFDLGFTSDFLLKKIKKREMQLWKVGDAYMITRIECHPDLKVLSVPFLAGENMDFWLDSVIDMLKQFAVAHDCKYIEVFGRKGWGKALKDYDFFETFKILRCKL